MKPELAEALGLTGLAGRASAVAWDLRVQFPPVPYEHFDVRMATHRNGDVAARVTVRFDEIAESLRLMGLIIAHLPAGDLHLPVPAVPDYAVGIGWVEGWRGEVLIALEAAAEPSPAAGSRARPFMAELAAARACGARQHRRRLSAHQQVVQPVVQRA